MPSGAEKAWRTVRGETPGKSWENPAVGSLSPALACIGGLALVAAAAWLGPQARLALGLLVGAPYLFGAVGNFRATRGRHPGWMLMALALAPIAFALTP